jgi:hypothetical protein
MITTSKAQDDGLHPRPGTLEQHDQVIAKMGSSRADPVDPAAFSTG